MIYKYWAICWTVNHSSLVMSPPTWMLLHLPSFHNYTIYLRMSLIHWGTSWQTSAQILSDIVQGWRRNASQTGMKSALNWIWTLIYQNQSEYFFNFFFFRIYLIIIFFKFSPEVKEGKEGAEQEKSAEQENNDTEKIEKELEKDKVCIFFYNKNYINFWVTQPKRIYCSLFFIFIIVRRTFQGKTCNKMQCDSWIVWDKPFHHHCEVFFFVEIYWKFVYLSTSYSLWFLWVILNGA